jgi:hypothetical protein
MGRDLRRLIDEVDARILKVDLGRKPQRVPLALRGRLTLGRFREVCGDRRIHPNSGWLIDQSRIETYVASLPKELRLERRRQLYNTLYAQDWLLRVGGRGGVAISHQNSVMAYLSSHHAQAAETHRQNGRGFENLETLAT